MAYLEIANGRLLYIMAGTVILFVVIQSIVFFRLAWQRGLAIGMTRGQLMEAVRTSGVFAIVPSIPIVISLIAIAPVLGVPFSWMRLSVIGSQAYELIAAGIGASSMGVESLGDPGYTAEVFSNSMWVMSVGIIWGLVMCLFVLKRYQQSMKNVKKKDSAWAEIMVNALFFGMLSVFLGRPVVNGGISLMVLVFSGVIMGLLTLLAKKTGLQWINDFALSVSMVAGMGFAVVLTQIGLG